MNLNITGYLIYLVVTIYIIVVVGRTCYRNGNIFVSALIPGHEDLCHKINQVLLVGYYLVNIGYCALTLMGWETMASLQQLVEAIAVKSAAIICMLSVLHYANIFVITNYIQKLIK